MTGPCMGRRAAPEEKMTDVPEEPKSTQTRTGSEGAMSGGGRTLGRKPAVFPSARRETAAG